MIGIKDKYAEKWGLSDSKWQQMIFTFVNPTNSDVTVEPFNPMVAATFNYPTSSVGVTSNIPITPAIISPAPFKNVVVEYDSGNGKVWSGNSGAGGNQVFSYDETTKTFNSPIICLNQISGISSISYSPINNTIAVSSFSGQYITIINATTETIIADINIGTIGVNWIEYNSTKNSWYISSSSDFIYEIDCVTNILIGTISLGVTVIPQNTAFNSNNNTLYVTDRAFGNNQIFKIDCVSNTVILIIPTGLYVITPFSITINPSTNKAYVGSQINVGAYIFNTLTDIFTTSIPITSTITDFQIHTLSNNIYAVGKKNPHAEQVSLINLTTDAIVNTIIGNEISDRLSIILSTTNNIIYISSTLGTRIVYLIAPSISNFYITGDSNYNLAVREGFNAPYWIRRMYFFSQNAINFNQNFFHVHKDANGNDCNLPQVPSLSVGTMQYQSGIGMIDYPNKECILGINQWYKNVVVKANSQLTMLFIYQQVDKASLLTKPTGDNSFIDNSFDDYTIQFNRLRKLNIKEIERNDIMPLNSDIRTEINVRPFNISDLNNALKDAYTEIN